MIFEILSWQCVTDIFIQLTLLWKLAAIVLPKPTKTALDENKSSSERNFWSFGKNLLYGFAAKMERDSKQNLYNYAKDLRSFRIVNLSGNGCPKLLFDLGSRFDSASSLFKAILHLILSKKFSLMI